MTFSTLKLFTKFIASPYDHSHHVVIYVYAYGLSANKKIEKTIFIYYSIFKVITFEIYFILFIECFLIISIISLNTEEL